MNRLPKSGRKKNQGQEDFMPFDAEARKADLIRKTIALSKKRLGKNVQNQFSRFLKTYYANVPPRDVQDSTPQTLFVLASGHWWNPPNSFCTNCGQRKSMISA